MKVKEQEGSVEKKIKKHKRYFVSGVVTNKINLEFFNAEIITSLRFRHYDEMRRIERAVTDYLHGNSVNVNLYSCIINNWKSMKKKIRSSNSAKTILIGSQYKSDKEYIFVAQYMQIK